MKTEHIVLGGLALGGLALALSPEARKKTKKAVGLSDKSYLQDESKRAYNIYVDKDGSKHNVQIDVKKGGITHSTQERLSDISNVKQDYHSYFMKGLTKSEINKVLRILKSKKRIK